MSIVENSNLQNIDDVKVSIAIPTYTDQTQDGYKNLLVLINSIELQNHKNLEIVISDHSLESNDIELYCNSKNIKLDIKYFRNLEDKGFWPSNLNNAIKHCSGQLIKLMLQDDFFISPFSLTRIVESYLENKFSWAAVGALHTRDYKTYYNKIIPHYSDEVYLGINKLGGPSCIVIKNDNEKLYFDKYLNWMGDCDYYRKMNEKYGAPHIIQDPLIAYKQWYGQFSNTMSNEVKNKEMDLVRSKYEKR